ncbi:hypothetical protein COU74_02475 [Candidatus Peregrinibacteria bacterium CG10_big_fil_rev_8_21_14_0_10_36_19]|nr:MAG: hypothetical protein COU74_02475 [Candidatus Peregrinibacteria bacterium CG10_big_fil_rev_8_21_14_0_10_36_19]
MEINKDLKCVVWDGDNTIWGWLEYAVPAYEAMCREIGIIAGKSFEETAEAMKEVYTKAGTLEYEGLIQDLVTTGFFSSVEGFNIDSTIRRVQKSFSDVRRENLHVYPGVSAVMREIHNRGIKQIMLTDAPGGQADARLRRSRLGSYMDEVFAMPTAEIKDIPDGFTRHFSGDGPRVNPLNEEKPHTDLENVLKMTRAEIAKHVAIIGDNRSKDMRLALLYECIGVHAAYGAADPDLVRRISVIAPPRVASRSMEIGGDELDENRIRTANKPTEILEQLY